MIKSISKRRFRVKRIIDDTLGKSLLKILSSRKKRNLPKKINKILIYKLSAIGDSILALPMIKLLKEKTKAEIIIVHSEDNKIVFQGQKFIDKTILLNVSGKNPFKIINCLSKIKKEEAEIAIDLSHTGKLSSIWASLTSKYALGFFNSYFPSKKNIFDFEFNLNHKKHMVLNYFGLISVLDIFPSKKELKLIKIKHSEKINLKKILPDRKNFIGIHACHEIEGKSWPKENFTEIINHLIKRGKTPVLIGSPKEVLKINELIKLIKNKTKIINLSGRLSLTKTISLMKNFDFFVCNDGGIMHLAASENLPTLGIFNAESPLRYAPFNRKSYSVHKNKISVEEIKKILDEYFL